MTETSSAPKASALPDALPERVFNATVVQQQTAGRI